MWAAILMHILFNICDRILENHSYGRILHMKYLALKSSLKFFFVNVWFQYSKNTLNYKEKCRNIENLFCDVSKVVVNSKILIVSGTPIRLIFRNSVTFISFQLIMTTRCRLLLEVTISGWQVLLQTWPTSDLISVIPDLLGNINYCWLVKYLTNNLKVWIFHFIIVVLDRTHTY